ncbi:hypothetical protein D9M69_431510 [compost metagenome]
MHAQLDATVGTARHTQVLDAVAQGLGVVDVGAGQFRDAFGVGLVELQRDAEGDGREDGQLVRGVDAFDVEGRVGLGVAQGLGFLQHVLEGAAFLAHFGEDEVAGAVDDAGQPVDAVGREAFADRLDHRDAAGHGGLEGDHDALLAGLGEDLVAVHGDQRLVGGDHVLAVLDGFEDQLAGLGVATDQLDDDVDFRVVDQLENVRGDGGGTGIAFRVRTTGGNLRNLDSTPGTAGNLLGVAFEYVEGAATDGPQATDAYFYRLHAELPIITAKTAGCVPAAEKSRTLRSGCLLVNQAGRPDYLASRASLASCGAGW